MIDIKDIHLSDHFTYGRLLRFCAPTMAMMFFTSIYYIVDSFFISNFAGKEAYAGANLILPVLNGMAALGMMMGMGGTALVSRVMGEGHREKAQRYFSMVIETTLTISTILGLIVAFFMEDIVLALGATPEIVEPAVIYGSIGAALSFLYTMQFMFQSLMGVAERPRLALFFTIAAGITNMILDLVFVGIMGWGVAGAAAATSMSEAIGGLGPLIYFILPNSTGLRFRPVFPEFRPLVKAMFNGSSELMTTMSSAIVAVAFNFQLLKYTGADGVAAYGVVLNTMFIFLSILIGFTMAAVPIVGYHYGAKNFREMNSLLLKSMVIELLGGILMFVLSEIFADPLAALFVGYDEALCEMTADAFRIYVIGFVLSGVNILTISYFTALNNGMVSGVLSFFRALVFQIIAVLALPVFFGISGIWWAPVITETLSLVLMVAALLYYDRDYHYFSYKKKTE